MSDLKTLQQLAAKGFDAIMKVENLEAELKSAKAALKQIEEVELPEAMDDIEMDCFETREGLRIEIATTIVCGKVTNPAALAYLEQEGDSGMIKADVTIAFGKEEEAEANKLMQRLMKQKFDVKQEKHVHQSTAKSYITRMLAEGKNIDLELFGAFSKRKAKITLPKRKKR